MVDQNPVVEPWAPPICWFISWLLMIMPVFFIALLESW